MALPPTIVATAIPLAERAVERSPRDAGFRAPCSAIATFAAGRFASAEAAYKRSLSPTPTSRRWS